MTLPDVLELFDYWEEYPPSHELLVIVSGFKSSKPAKASESSGAMDPISFMKWSKVTRGRRIGPNG